MYIEKSEIEVIHVEREIFVIGINLQNSGLPITFESLGKMWEKYTEELKEKTPNRTKKQVKYGICLNKVPDYIVGLEVTEIAEPLTDYKSYTIRKGDYVKASFNAENHDILVDHKLMAMEKEAKKWAKTNKIKIDPMFTVEVYPKETIDQEYPEMYVMLPVI